MLGKRRALKKPCRRDAVSLRGRHSGANDCRFWGDALTTVTLFIFGEGFYRMTPADALIPYECIDLLRQPFTPRVRR